ADFFTRRTRACFEARQQLIDLTGTDAYRLVHGEGDGLPGVVIDLYAGWAVMKLYSAGLTPYRPMLVKALEPFTKGVVGRDEIGRDDAERDDEQGRGRMLAGERAPERVTILERGAK